MNSARFDNEQRATREDRRYWHTHITDVCDISSAAYCIALVSIIPYSILRQAAWKTSWWTQFRRLVCFGFGAVQTRFISGLRTRNVENLDGNTNVPGMFLTLDS